MLVRSTFMRGRPSRQPTSAATPRPASADRDSVTSRTPTIAITAIAVNTIPERMIWPIDSRQRLRANW
jgi:hypothetical protein